jgi:hypothetical protein
MLKDRPSPVSPEKTNATHRIPAIIPRSELSDDPKAKLNMIRTKKENKHMERIISLVLNSETKSFQTMAPSLWTNFIKPPKPDKPENA